MQREGWCIWITGLPGSGKSVIAQALMKKLEAQGIHVQIVSSDMMREVVTPVPKYTQDERDMVYNAIVFVSKLLAQNGVNVIVDATGNRRQYRDLARESISRFMEAYVRCPLEVCIQRETQRKETFHAPTEIYKKGLSGRSATVPGINVPYDEPCQPEVIVDSDKMDVDQCAQKIYEVIEKTFPRDQS